MSKNVFHVSVNCCKRFSKLYARFPTPYRLRFLQGKCHRPIWFIEFCDQLYIRTLVSVASEISCLAKGLSTPSDFLSDSDLVASRRWDRFSNPTRFFDWRCYYQGIACPVFMFPRNMCVKF